MELVADGGSENHARNITEFLETCITPPIHIIIAKKDIVFSNSPIEAVNKIVKQYLRYFKPQNLNELKKCIEWIINDYNNREHGALKGLTPLEVYTNKEPLDFKVQIKNARGKRVEENRNSCCVTCQ